MKSSKQYAFGFITRRHHHHQQHLHTPRLPFCRKSEAVVVEVEDEVAREQRVRIRIEKLLFLKGFSLLYAIISQKYVFIRAESEAGKNYDDPLPGTNAKALTIKIPASLIKTIDPDGYSIVDSNLIQYPQIPCVSVMRMAECGSENGG